MSQSGGDGSCHRQQGPTTNGSAADVMDINRGREADEEKEKKKKGKREK